MTSKTDSSDGALAARLADDALARWRWLVERRERTIEALRGPGAGADYWATGATSFPRASDVTEPEPVRDYLLARIDATQTVLDVGAGTGRLALPVARVARSVVAVEPSAAMASILREEMARWRLANIRIIQETWIDADVEPADVVICANVLTPIADLGPFLVKLEARAKRACYIILRGPSPDAPLENAWLEVHGRDHPREPTYLDALAALAAVGIAAQLTLLPSPTVWSRGFESAAALEALARSRLWLPDAGADAIADQRLRRFLDLATVERDGRFYLPSGPGHAAVIWWLR